MHRSSMRFLRMESGSGSFKKGCNFGGGFMLTYKKARELIVPGDVIYTIEGGGC